PARDGLGPRAAGGDPAPPRLRVGRPARGRGGACPARPARGTGARRRRARPRPLPRPRTRLRVPQRRGGRALPRRDLRQADAAADPLRFPDPHFVWLRRDDEIAQAVSFWRAVATGHWHAWDPPPREAEFDRDAITHLLEEIRAHNAAWRAWFRENAVAPLDVR